MSIGIGHAHLHERNFTIVTNALIRDRNISLEAGRLLIWMLSNQNGFEYSHTRIKKYWAIGHSKAERIITELQDKNYLHIEKKHTGKTIWHYFEDPHLCLAWKEGIHLQGIDSAPNPQNGDEAIQKPDLQNGDLQNGDPLRRLSLEQENDPKDSCPKTDSDDAIQGEVVSLEDDLFDEFWESGIRKDAKIKARVSFRTVMRGKTDAKKQEFNHFLIADIKTRLDLEQPMFDMMLPTTYLNGERWNDSHKSGKPKVDAYTGMPIRG